MIGIINYGLGNIKAFYNIFYRLNSDVKIINTPKDLKEAKKLILPGVGSFDAAINKLNNSGLRNSLEEQVLVRKIPILGICVGMHIMANKSEEGKSLGLGWIDGEVKLLKESTQNNKLILPHMGWNKLVNSCESDLLKGINQSRFYFLHSYYFDTSNEKNIIGKTVYGKKFASAISKENIYGLQFHPEKSHSQGEKLLTNFNNI